MTMKGDDHDLDRLLTAARGAGPAPGPDLMARILADAAAVQPKASPRRQPAPRRQGWLTGIATIFGGGGALAGISFAMLAGVFVGIVQPAPVAALTQAFAEQEVVDSVDMLPSEAALWAEDQDD